MVRFSIPLFCYYYLLHAHTVRLVRCMGFCLHLARLPVDHTRSAQHFCFKIVRSFVCTYIPA